MPFIALPKGRTHYELAGSPQGPVVVLLHGGTVPLWAFDLQVPALLQAGLRVLRYDMFGKGLSDSPRAVYDRQLYCGQLLDLLDALGLHGPVDLAGFSFGGATAASFAVRHPDRVARVALLSPVVCFEEGNRVLDIVRLPLIGRVFLQRVVMKKAARRAARLWSGAGDDERHARLFVEQMARPGFTAALASFMRSDALGDYRPVYRALGGLDKPLLLVWGDRDEDIPAAHTAQLRALLPRAAQHELPGVGHGTVLRAADAVNRLLLEFLR